MGIPPPTIWGKILIGALLWYLYVYTLYFAGHGFLTVEDLKKVFSKVAPHIPVQAVHSAFRYGPFKSQDIDVICVQTFKTARKDPVHKPISETPENIEMTIKAKFILGKKRFAYIRNRMCTMSHVVRKHLFSKQRGLYSHGSCHEA